MPNGTSIPISVTANPIQFPVAEADRNSRAVRIATAAATAILP
jgi:hypothetical protein